jgi:hypothetical protein
MDCEVFPAAKKVMLPNVASAVGLVYVKSVPWSTDDLVPH